MKLRARKKLTLPLSGPHSIWTRSPLKINWSSGSIGCNFRASLRPFG
ncbi:unnamed protein product [Schistosoma curassoni]|uniref:Uncharacterized protein n=1 Tax=Schistosoma curassoni TaxID=6186 RepID=A0A183KTZ1_9TREM|nr:unnamed protein product [Schistosoma curassoni]